MNIIKASGKREGFNEEKLRRSLQRIGTEEKNIDRIIDEVKRRAYPNIQSKKILEIILFLLKKESPILAARYNLKSAMMNLGPSGYPFEQYFAGILEEYGYKTKVCQGVKGYCVQQEIDIVATKNNKRFMVECKYHNTSGVQSDLKVALYTYARFLDVKDTEKFDQAILVTNTKLTSEAIKFAECKDIKTISWHYPENMRLEKLIEDKLLYPITILFSLKNSTRIKLLNKKIIFAKELLDINIESFSKEMNIKEEELINLRDEAQSIKKIITR